MDWKAYLESKAWKDLGICKTCTSIKWTWSKREYQIVLLGQKQTLFVLKHKGLNTGTYKIYELEEKVKDI